MAIRWLTGTLIGSSAYLGLISTMRSANRGTAFHPGFLGDLVVDLLGHSPLTVVIMGAGVAIALWSLRTRAETKALVVLFAAVVLGLWLVVRPRDLYPRFFVWAVPAVAAAAAVGLSRVGQRRFMTPAVAIACVFAFAVSVHGNTSDEFANRAAATYVAAAQSRGEAVCGLGTSTEALGPYATQVRFCIRPSRLRPMRLPRCTRTR
jgi:hypothetical protein